MAGGSALCRLRDTGKRAGKGAAARPEARGSSRRELRPCNNCERADSALPLWKHVSEQGPS